MIPGVKTLVERIMQGVAFDKLDGIDRMWIQTRIEQHVEAYHHALVAGCAIEAMDHCTGCNGTRCKAVKGGQP